MYTITIKNEGNADAADVVVTRYRARQHIVRFCIATVARLLGTLLPGRRSPSPPGSSITRTLTVNVADALKKKVTAIVNDGYRADAAGGFYTTGSPVVTTLAESYAVGLSPSTQTDGAKVGAECGLHCPYS